MPQSFEAQVGEIADGIEEKMRRVVVNSIQDMMERMQRTARGKSVGGSITEGLVPVVSSDLVNSLESRLRGGSSLSGPESYVAVLADYDLGDVVDMGWTMDYAARVHWGFMGTDSLGRSYNQEGWHWVSANLPEWQAIVDKNKALFG